MIKIDFDSYTSIRKHDTNIYDKKINDLKKYIKKYNMAGFLDVDTLFNTSIINDLKVTANYIKENADYFLVIGIGGSYLGAKAVIDLLDNYEETGTKVIFIGHDLSSDYLASIFKKIENKNIVVNIISKSGSTLETTVVTNLIMNFMKNKYDNEEMKKRIIITTGDKGPLREKSNEYKTYDVPNNIGGRYSIFTPVGLLTLAVKGYDLNKLYLGAKKATLNINDEIKYAIYREVIYNKGHIVGAFTCYESKMYYFTEWLKQLYGESLGKENKGILPISFINTRDLHSMEQYIEEGKKIIFETVFNVKNSVNNYHIIKYDKTLNDINNIVSKSVSETHFKNKVPNIVFDIEMVNEETVGYLMQFFMVSCAISGFLSNVNAFNQEGVEAYKKKVNENL